MHTNIRRPCRNGFDYLILKGQRAGHTAEVAVGQKLVVEAAAAAQTVAGLVEGQPRDDDQVDIGDGDR